MKTITCDKCCNTIPLEVSVYTLKTEGPFQVFGSDNSDIDLCDSCYKKLRDWIKV